MCHYHLTNVAQLDADLRDKPVRRPTAVVSARNIYVTLRYDVVNVVVVSNRLT